MPITVTDITTISIDTVYQRVLALANKEQRGYITPQEFNLHANQAQLDIFEQYFYDLAAMTNLKARGEAGKPGINNPLEPDFGDTVNIIREKLSIYKGADAELVPDTTNKCYRLPPLATGLYRTGRMYYSGTNGSSIPLTLIEQTDIKPIVDMYNARNNSRWHIADSADFFYTENSDGSFSLYKEDSDTPITASGQLKIEVIAGVPAPVKWGYVVVNEKALYDASNSTDFNLHRSEETNLVIKILELAGITINKPGLVQIASNEEAQNDGQTK
jgi:hypothetical protein|tara:strand:+ start:50 stop:868 length:819 start_codon:yes stop_codon:yes gene_type:complete